MPRYQPRVLSDVWSLTCGLSWLIYLQCHACHLRLWRVASWQLENAHRERGSVLPVDIQIVAAEGGEGALDASEGQTGGWTARRRAPRSVQAVLAGSARTFYSGPLPHSRLPRRHPRSAGIATGQPRSFGAHDAARRCPRTGALRALPLWGWPSRYSCSVFPYLPLTDSMQMPTSQPPVQPHTTPGFSTEIWREIALWLPPRDLKSLLHVPHVLSRIASELLFQRIDLQLGRLATGNLMKRC